MRTDTSYMYVHVYLSRLIARMRVRANVWFGGA